MRLTSIIVLSIIPASLGFVKDLKPRCTNSTSLVSSSSTSQWHSTTSISKPTSLSHSVTDTSTTLSHNVTHSTHSSTSLSHNSVTHSTWQSSSTWLSPSVTHGTQSNTSWTSTSHSHSITVQAQQHEASRPTTTFTTPSWTSSTVPTSTPTSTTSSTVPTTSNIVVPTPTTSSIVPASATLDITSAPIIPGSATSLGPPKTTVSSGASRNDPMVLHGIWVMFGLVLGIVC